MSGYEKYNNLSREILDKVQVGDLVKVNDWKRPYRVAGISENYFVVYQQMFGNVYYSVFSKNPTPVNYIRNNIIGGCFYCGADHWLFGWRCGDYQFKDEKWVTEYLASFESGESRISHRRSESIRTFYLKKKKRKSFEWDVWNYDDNGEAYIIDKGMCPDRDKVADFIIEHDQLPAHYKEGMVINEGWCAWRVRSDWADIDDGKPCGAYQVSDMSKRPTHMNGKPLPGWFPVWIVRKGEWW